MLKTIRWICFALVLVMCLSLSGCSSSGPFAKERTHKSEDDKAKFYGFEWLTTKKEVDKKFNEDFSDVSFTIYPQAMYERVNDNIGVYGFLYVTKDDDGKYDVITNIGGCDVEQIYLEFIAYNSDYGNDDKMYLIKARINFISKTRYTADKLENLLERNYRCIDRTDYTFSDHLEATYTDSNNNNVELYYFGAYKTEDWESDGTMRIEYICMDLDEYKRREQGRSSNSSNGL